MKRLFVLLEGDDDVRFFKKVLLDPLRERFDSVILWKFAQQKKKKVAAFIRTVQDLGSDYLLFTDMDEAPCVTEKKRGVRRAIDTAEARRVLIVIREIEAWYLAGVTDDDARALGLSMPETTDRITKEAFNALKPRRFDSRIDFMMEILKRYSLETARRRNRSFRYFSDRTGIPY